ncbi:MAG: tRNA (adenosine(37)-N6)-dimethylallyltransferase MiaA [Planctomycetota bacterium]
MALVSHAWFLTGPTAVGKTAVGLALAEKMDAEIISMDSMAIYRSMDIGTAKPTVEEQKRVRHHLIDTVAPHEDFSLAKYLGSAQEIAEEISSRGRQVLFLGGTPLYLKGLLRGIFEGPPADWEFRGALMKKSESNEPGWLHDQLKSVDPPTAARLHANDIRRIIRALEVFERTGRPISELQQQFERGMPAEACRVFVLDRPKEELQARIDRRVESMFSAGLVDEVRRLLADPRGLSKTARQAVGYAEVIDYYGEKHDLAATVDRVKMHTRQLAKRQATWFRSLSECRFVNIETDCPPETVAEQILALPVLGAERE